MAAPNPSNPLKVLDMKDVIGAVITAMVVWVILKFVVKVSDEEAMGGAVMVLIGGLVSPIAGNLIGKQLKLEKMPA